MTDVLLLDDFVAAFIECTLPKKQWTHHAHLKVGLWHLLRFPPEQALEHLRERIKRYNLASGTQNTERTGYHETITRFYVWAINRFLQSADRSQTIEILADRLISELGSNELPLQYFSRERLKSTAARLSWVEPDLLPMEES